MVNPDSGEAVLKSALYAKMRTNISDIARAAGTHATTLELWATRDSVRVAPDVLEKLATQLMGATARYDAQTDKLYRVLPEPKPMMIVAQNFDPKTCPYAYENLRAAAGPLLPLPPGRRPGWK